MSLKVLKSILLSFQLEDAARVILGTSLDTEIRETQVQKEFGLDLAVHSPKPFSVRLLANRIVRSKNLPRETELLRNLNKCLTDISECNRAISFIDEIQDREFGDEKHSQFVSDVVGNLPSECDLPLSVYEGLSALELVILRSFLVDCFALARTTVSLRSSFPFHRITKRICRFAVSLLVERRSLDYLMFPSNNFLNIAVSKSKMFKTSINSAIWEAANKFFDRGDSLEGNKTPTLISYGEENAEILKRFCKVCTSLYIQFLQTWKENYLDDDLDSINKCFENLEMKYGDTYIMSMPLKIK
eukprot:CAMPEP_0184007404 /NCGR_PEP_ID=MMETSP0954-20121128/1305_1 /TAXON_ID=627963 /ORGANISM="Aplanochytrium sp, Strain PBS07" /LENGTH=300 /DNA_ID=CAMNT_0026286211 /DNA_START=208 /DNA_END=1110 /DNA_ORIENTATION=+